MKNLLIEEMKRAIQIMESKAEIKKIKTVTVEYKNPLLNYSYDEIDRETTELRQLFLAIRKHSILLEKEFK